MLTKLIAVAFGGMIGSVLRFYVYIILEKSSKNFPLNTFLVNILGCFLIGIFSEVFILKVANSANLRLFLITGFLGAFTTFSTFILDSTLMLQKSEVTKAVIYLVLSIIIGILSYFIAVYITRSIFIR